LILIYCLFNLLVGNSDFSFNIRAEYIILIFLIGVNILIYNLNKGTFNPLSPDIIFYFLFLLFHFGYIILYYFGLIDTYNNEIFYNAATFSNSVYFLIACLSSFLIGYILFFNKLGTLVFNNKFYDVINVDRIYFLSKFFIIFSLILFWVPILSLGFVVFIDYSLVNRIGELSAFGKFFWVGQIFSVFSISIYYISKFSLKKKFISDLFSLLPLLYILGFLLIGQRAYVLYYLVVVMSAYQFFYKKINFPKLILFSVCVLSVSRVESVYNPIEAYALYSQNKENNPVVSSISEFGSTFKTIPIIMTYIPDYYSYLNGSTLYSSLKIALPNFGSARESNNLATWLTETAFGDNTWGRGGSIAMEAYGNFGIIGSQFFFLVLGIIFALSYNRLYENKKFYHVLFYFLILAAVCLWMRNTSTFVFRIVIWGSLAYFLCLFICKLNIWKSSK
jgi:oligosaccharide repeat unit polymerase